MNRVVYDRPDLMIEWAEDRIENCAFRDDAHAIGVADKTGLVTGVFVFDTFTRNSCLMHVAANGHPLWLGRQPREVLTSVFSYPFVQCGFSRVTALVLETNIRSIRFAERLGGKREGVLREEGPNGEDMVILGLLRRECRFTNHLALSSPAGKRYKN